MRTIIRKTKTFRLRSDLIERLQQKAAEENRTLNNFVECVLLDVLYHEPNKVTRAAISEAKSRHKYPANELYDNAEQLFEALDSE